MPQVKLQKRCAEPEVKLLYLCLPVHPSLSISPLLPSLFVLPPILSFAPPFFPPLSFLPYSFFSSLSSFIFLSLLLSFVPPPLSLLSSSFLPPYSFLTPYTSPASPSLPPSQEGSCRQCFCRPMWCFSCMSRWFAARQNQQQPETWMESTAPCPMCRAQFCVLDVLALQGVELE